MMNKIVVRFFEEKKGELERGREREREVALFDYKSRRKGGLELRTNFE